MSVEELSSVIVINIINVDCTESEADVNNNKDEKENHDINNHVGHGDDDRPSLSPHKASLEKRNNCYTFHHQIESFRLCDKIDITLLIKLTRIITVSICSNVLPF